MVDIDLVEKLAVAGLCLLSVASCAPADPVPPWEPDEMVRQLLPDLRYFEGPPPEFSETEILAWRIDSEPGQPSRPRIPVPGGSGFMPPQERRVERALLWRRRGPRSAPLDWALVQVHRFPGSETPWQRAVISRELTAPLTRLRPGEAADGTWHGYQRYDWPPTSRDACDFAAVAFLADDPPWLRIAGAFRHRAWTRAIGAAPVCGFPE